MQNRKPKNKKLQMTFSIIFLSALFIVEIYLMLNHSENYLLLGIIGLIMLCLIYRITDLNFKIQNEKEARYEKEYENIYKSEKASYILLKKNFQELSRKVDEVIKNEDMPINELIRAQKSIAKVTIHRSKENATAIMNSNDKLLEQFISLEDKLVELKAFMEESQNENRKLLNRDVPVNQQEVISKISEMELFLKDEISQMVNVSSAEKEQSPAVDVLPESVPVERKVEENPPVEEFVLNQLEEEPVVNEEVIEEKEPEYVEELIVNEELAVEEEPEPVEEPMIEEPIVNEDFIVEEEPEPVEEPMIEEPVVNEDFIVEEEPEPVEEPMIEEPIIEEQVMEEPAYDPNHIMTPSEIEALLGESSKEEVISEPEPEEEKPAMPDLSDPGHVMTPEEIAALLANL